jgi:hypothetical protein
MGVDDPITFTRRTVEIEGGRMLYLYEFATPSVVEPSEPPEHPEHPEQPEHSESSEPPEPPNSPSSEPKR